MQRRTRRWSASRTKAPAPIKAAAIWKTRVRSSIILIWSQTGCFSHLRTPADGWFNVESSLIRSWRGDEARRGIFTKAEKNSRVLVDNSKQIFNNKRLIVNYEFKQNDNGPCVRATISGETGRPKRWGSAIRRQPSRTFWLCKAKRATRNI